MIMSNNRCVMSRIRSLLVVAPMVLLTLSGSGKAQNNMPYGGVHSVRDEPTAGDYQRTSGISCVETGGFSYTAYGHATLREVDCGINPYRKSGNHVYIKVDTINGGDGSNAYDNNVSLIYDCYTGVGASQYERGHALYKGRRQILAGSGITSNVNVESAEYRNEYKLYYDRLRRNMAQEIKNCVSGTGSATATEADEAHIDEVIIKPSEDYYYSPRYYEYDYKSQEAHDVNHGGQSGLNAGYTSGNIADRVSNRRNNKCKRARTVPNGRRAIGPRGIIIKWRKPVSSSDDSGPLYGHHYYRPQSTA